MSDQPKVVFFEFNCLRMEWVCEQCGAVVVTDHRRVEENTAKTFYYVCTKCDHSWEQRKKVIVRIGDGAEHELARMGDQLNVARRDLAEWREGADRIAKQRDGAIDDRAKLRERCHDLEVQMDIMADEHDQTRGYRQHAEAMRDEAIEERNQAQADWTRLNEHLKGVVAHRKRLKEILDILIDAHRKYGPKHGSLAMGFENAADALRALIW